MKSVKPGNLQTKIFLDSGDPEDTKKIIADLHFLDGQTTNPTLIAKNPDAQKRLVAGTKFSRDEILKFYRNVVETISDLIPNGSVSVEVYADKQITVQEMVKQAKDMFFWIPNAHIKLPITRAGLEAAEELIHEGVHVNMTLCFSQAQAAAVYAATRGARRGQVFVSPFVGRLDDIGTDGMSLVQNLLRMYAKGDRHVEVLAASVRTQNHFLRTLQLGSDIVTAPLQILTEWATGGRAMPKDDFRYDAASLTSIPYETIDLGRSWQSFDITHPLTDKGLERFSADWNALIA